MGSIQITMVTLLLCLSAFAISTAQARDSVALFDEGVVKDAGTHTAEVQEHAAKSTKTGVCEVSCPKAVTGDSANLLVHVNPPFDWTKERMDVKRDDLGDVTVYSFQYKKDHLLLQSAQYKDRTTFISSPSGGIFRISNLTTNDSGSYTFYFPGLKASCHCILRVVNTSSTTEPPVNNTSKPNNDDTGTKEPLWKTVLPSVAVVLLLLVAAGVYLWKSGKMKICVRRFRGTQRPEPKTHEMEMLNHQPAGTSEDAHNGKANGLECVNIIINNNSNNNNNSPSPF